MLVYPFLFAGFNVTRGHGEVPYVDQSRACRNTFGNRVRSERRQATEKTNCVGEIANSRYGVAGDVERSPSGRLSLRTSAKNMGLAADPLFSYNVYVFPSANEYSFGNGPVDREEK